MSAIQQSLLSTNSGPVIGEVTFSGISEQTWVVPDGCFTISAVAVGKGGDENNQHGGRGGALSYSNTLSVTPGETLSISMSEGATALKRGATVLLMAQANGYASNGVGQVKFTGGIGGTGYDQLPSTYLGGGGGGAAGYAGNGGNGATYYGADATGGAGGGGGGGGRGYLLDTIVVGGHGGGVGLMGQGANGAAGPTSRYGGPGGSGSGGGYGAGAGGGGGAGGPPGIRIIFPGNLRRFPSTRTASE